MYRTASNTRIADEYCTRSALGLDHLPIYDRQLEITKKETASLRFAESMVHLIPVVIIICAMVLWISSNEIEMASEDDSILDRIKNMTIDGYDNLNETSVTIGKGDLDPIGWIETGQSARDNNNQNQV